MKVTNEEVRERTRSEKIRINIKIRRWRWIGHVSRMKCEMGLRTRVAAE